MMQSPHFPIVCQSNGVRNHAYESGKWVTHYSSAHKILLVGEGDFSFSLSLALGFGTADNICATSLNSYDNLKGMYANAEANLWRLYNLGATLIHGVDATDMKEHPVLKMHRFDRIVYNFPHAGFFGKEDDPAMIKMHQTLVSAFFSNARCLLQENGQIHVAHKTEPPYSCWDVEKLALENSLCLIECVPFKIEDYPYYQNKRGHGSTCDESFRLGDCSTYKFTLMPLSSGMPFGHLSSREPFNNQLLNTGTNTFSCVVTFSPKEIQGYWSTQSSVHFSQISPFIFSVQSIVRNYPRVAGHAGVLVDEKGLIRAKFCGPLPYMDSDFAELHAIKYALLMFERSSLCRTVALTVESDSQNAVSWIKSSFGNPWEVEAVLCEIKMSLDRMQNVRVCCGNYGVKLNCLVDILAAKGMNMDSVAETWLHY